MGGGLPRGNLVLKVEVTPSSLHSHATDILGMKHSQPQLPYSGLSLKAHLVLS